MVVVSALTQALLSIVISVAAQFALKAGTSLPATRSALEGPWSWHAVAAVAGNPFVIAGFALYAVGAALWIAVLAQWDVSKAYPLVGLGFALSVVVGSVLGEPVGAMRVGGVLLIIAGIIVIARS